MKVRKKLLSSLLALAMSFYALPTVWAEDLSQQIQDTPENSCSDAVTTDTAATDAPQTEDEAAEDSVETDIPRDEENTDSEEIFETDPPQTEDEDNSADSETTPEQDGENADNAPNEDGISVMSLLPIEEIRTEVLLNRTAGIPEGLENEPQYSFYVKEALHDAFVEKGLIGDSEDYNGTILYSVGSSEYREIGWNDIITPSSTYSDTDSDYGYVEYAYTHFIINNDQLNMNNTHYLVTVYFKYDESFLKDISLNLFNEDGKSLKVYNNDRLYLYLGGEPANKATVLQNYISYTEYGAESGATDLYLLITLPDGYSQNNVEVYDGLIRDESGVESSVNITAKIINDGTDKTPYKMEITDALHWSKKLTFVITKETGVKSYIPGYIYVYTNQNHVSLNISSNAPYCYSSLHESPNSDYGYSYSKVYKADSFDDIKASVYAYYYDFIDQNSDGSGYVDVSKIEHAYFITPEDGKTDIKDKLFSYSGIPIDLSKCKDTIAYLDDGTKVNVKIIEVFVTDIYGIHHECNAYFAIGENVTVTSDDTYFNINGARKTDDDDDYKRLLNYYIVGSSNDSYFKNGYQTVFLLDKGKPIADGATIYPYFSKSSGVNVYADGYQGTQTSGESPITFESGKAIQYSAASESGTHLKNYWVTFVTPQSGPKLFVNATNNPDHYSESGKAQREMFLKSSRDYHDIFFANIGDETLSGIKVALSGDAQGVKLDDYWTVIDSSVGTLAPFTKTSSLDNIAKIRLIPVSDDYFGDISGTLTISSANGGSQEIELTGIAGIPKITTDKLYDGIKYVPYSSVIMTNSMYGSDSMSFSLYGGSLPDGLELRPNGEIYGIPTKTGEFRFAVEAVYNGAKQENGAPYSCIQYYTIVIADNTDENVDSANTDEQGHPMIEKVSKYITVYYSGENGGKPIVDRIEIDSDLFWSEGALGELQDFYIDGIKLAKGSDYTAEEGSTKITVRAQTFGHIGITGSEVPHTLAAEFRTADTNELKRSAQNVYLNYEKFGGSSNPGGNTGNTGNTGSSGGNGNSNNTGVVPVFNKSSGTVSAVIGIVDADGNPVSGLELELHSKPMYASTDSSGAAKFDSVEFGRHTLYIKNPSNNKKISKTFTIASGSNTGIKGSVITASEGETISLTIEYDGSEIKILSVAEDVSSGSGVHGNGEIAFVISKNIFLKRILILIVIFAAAILASILAVRKRFLTK